MSELDGELERELAQIWCDLLGRDRVGRDDNFYELGGHPALVMHMGSAIRDAFGVDIPQRLLFDGTDIATLSVIVVRALVAQVQSFDPEVAARMLDEIQPQDG